jgi:hypothetical protein
MKLSMKKNIYGALLLLAALALAAGCRTAPKNITETAILLGRDSPGERSFRLTGPFPAKSALEGTVLSEDENGMVLNVESYRSFTNWKDGWTDALLSASGTLVVEKRGKQASVTGTPSIDYPSRATIRYRDTIIEGDAGLKQFANRWDRIGAAVDFFRSQGARAEGR